MIETAYIGRGECGCAKAICTFDSEGLGDVLKEWVECGMSVHNLPKEEAKAEFMKRCPHEEPDQPEIFND